MIDQKTQTNIDSNDILQVITQQRNAALDAIVQLQAVIASKDRQITALREAVAKASVDAATRNNSGAAS